MERRRAIWNAADLQARLYRKEKKRIIFTALRHSRAPALDIRYR
jgi:hypothetical protein